jgi:N-acetylmuramoyl-L-alanine amidase
MAAEVDPEAAGPVTPREVWGAEYGRGNVMPDPAPKRLVVLHHAASPDLPCGCGQRREMEAVRSIERYHVRDRGWAAIGYSFLVTQSGRLYEGRGWGRVGAHTPGRNSSAYGVCCLWDGARHAATEAALEAFAELVAVGVAGGHIAPDWRLGAHCWYRDTDCPGGRLMAQLDRFGLLAE